MSGFDFFWGTHGALSPATAQTPQPARAGVTRRSAKETADTELPAFLTSPSPVRTSK